LLGLKNDLLHQIAGANSNQELEEVNSQLNEAKVAFESSSQPRRKNLEEFEAKMN